jgi:hypothetical protein
VLKRMSKELDTVDHYDQMNQVVSMMLKGSNPRQIAKSTGLKVIEVNKYIDEWQGYARNNKHIQDRAREALSATDQHYDMIINRLWETVETADYNDDLRTKASTLKMIADIEQKRIEMLQKSGLLDNQQLADEVIEVERKQELLVNILRKLANEHPASAKFVREELSKVTGIAESVVVTVESN